jgi:tetratricopeptide (TPR) repeat protein
MISRWLLLPLSVVVLSPNLLCAQSPPRGKRPIWPSNDPIPDIGIITTIDDYKKMYEDIEILRRILDRKLHSLYSRSINSSMGNISINGFNGLSSLGMGMVMGDFSALNTMGIDGMGMGMGNGLAWPQEVDHPLEGVYLKGQGIVYTATLSSLQLPAQAETVKQISEWESVRRQLHNEKESPKGLAASKPLELSEVVLKVLAENGHHFAQLGDNESLTVVVTVRGTNPVSVFQKPARDSATQRPRPSADGGGRDPFATERTGAASLEPPQPSAGRGEGNSDFSSRIPRIHDLELLGDLHLKQGHYDEATAAFVQAMMLCQGFRGDPIPKQEAQVAALHRKLAQCYLMKGEDEKASAELNKAIAFLKKTADTKDKPAPATKSAAATLPVKLIISAPKKLLDQVGERKITFDEFRRHARVEMLTFNNRRP